MATLPLSPQVFVILSALIEERAGLHYGAGASEVFADKVSQRAEEAGFDSLLEYYYFLRYDPASADELDALLDVLVVGETYFFREADQLGTMVDDFLLPAAQAGRRPRVWCAGCATGEEPLTIAMMLAEREALGQVDIMATDLSRRALTRAREGIYPARSLRALPLHARRWLTSAGTDYRIDPELRAAVTWSRFNLIKWADYPMLGGFDAVVCRNVLIYFSDATMRKVVEGFTASLRPGGHLLIGASESLLRFGITLRCRERRGAFFYTKAP